MVSGSVERDVRALRWVGEQFGVEWDVLAVLLGRLSPGGARGPLGFRGTRQVYDRWVRQGLAVKWRVGQSGRLWVVPTRRGFAGRPWRPGSALSLLEHMRQVAVVRLFVEARGGRDERWAGVEWVSERVLRRGSEFAGAGVHCPDGLLRFPSGRVLAVEVELTVKSDRDPWGGRRLDRIVAESARRWDGVLYVCAPSVQPVVERVRDGLPGPLGRRVQVTRLPSLAEATVGVWGDTAGIAARTVW